MNRREALAALISMPQIARIERADIKPDDVIVVECEGRVSLVQKEYMRDTLGKVWPGRRIVVCEAGIRIKAMSQ